MQLRVPQKQLVLLPWAITEVAAASEVPKMDLQGLLLTSILFFLEEKGRDSCAFYFFVTRGESKGTEVSRAEPAAWSLGAVLPDLTAAPRASRPGSRDREATKS